jgi:hypothetical protein
LPHRGCMGQGAQGCSGHDLTGGGRQARMLESAPFKRVEGPAPADPFRVASLLLSASVTKPIAPALAATSRWFGAPAPSVRLRLCPPAAMAVDGGCPHAPATFTPPPGK